MLRVGDVLLGTVRRFTSEDLSIYSRLTGDYNPLHSNGLVHGALVLSLIPALFAHRVPGALYLSQHAVFRHRVMTGDTVQARIQVLSVTGRLAHCRTECWNTDTDTMVLQGEAKVLAPILRK